MASKTKTSKQLTNATKITSGLKNVGKGLIAAGSLVELLKALYDYKKVCEQERTERMRIESEERIAIAQIEATREVMMRVVDAEFQERKEIFRRLFVAMDIAIEQRDVELLGLVAGTIVELAKTSPLEAVSMGRTQRLGLPQIEP